MGMESASTDERQVVVSAVGLTKVFRDFWNRPKAKAVNDIDFEIKEGEVVGLLGPNGSGKSTTVKMLLGLLYPTGGRLTVFGKSPRDVDTKKMIGYLPEETYLYKYLTASETLDFFASLFKLSKEDRKSRCAQLLDMVGLAHAGNRPVGEFSKGMARRIGLAQAMLNDPALLILDEPTSGLDPIGCKEVKDLILLLKKRGKTVIVTSHLLSDVEEVCDRIIVLYGGKIRANGPLDSLLTIQSSNTITTPELPEEKQKKLISELKEIIPDGSFDIRHPRMSLEEFFLDLVKHAQSESLDTSGAHAGGKIASYLTENEEKPSAEQVLNQLVAGEDGNKAEDIDQILQKEFAERKEVEARKRQDDLFKNLSQNATPETREQQRIQEQIENDKRKLEDVNKKLQGLLSNKDK